MKRTIVVLALALGVWAMAVPPGQALELAPPHAAGTVRVVQELSKYGTPEIGPFRFDGAFSTGAHRYVGAVHGSVGRASDGWPIRFEGIELRSPDGRLVGSCSMPYNPPFLVPQALDVPGPADHLAPLDCSVRIDGGVPVHLTIHLAAVRHSHTSEAGGAYTRDVYQGAFASA